MNDSSSSHIDASGNPIPVSPIQERLVRIGFVGAVVLLISMLLFGRATVSVETNGDSTIYTRDSLGFYLFSVLPLLTAIATVVYLLQPGKYRIFGVVLALTTVWLIYTVATTDTSNHNVTVTPTGFSREVGTKSAPVRHTIDFTTTAYLHIDEVPGIRRPNYELVAYSDPDGVETRVPIFGMMRAALPQILKYAGEHDVIIGESADGFIIPSELRNMEQ